VIASKPLEKSGRSGTGDMLLWDKSGTPGLVESSAGDDSPRWTADCSPGLVAALDA
jgi:hypothetical protein